MDLSSLRKPQARSRRELLRKLTRRMIIEQFEDRRVLSGNDTTCNSDDSGAANQQQIDFLLNSKEAQSWLAQSQNAEDIVLQQQAINRPGAEELLLQHLASNPGMPESESSLSGIPSSSTGNSITDAISRTIVQAASPQHLISTHLAPNASIAISIETQSQASNVAEANSQKWFDSQQISQTISQSASPGQILNGQLSTVNNLTGANSSIQQTTWESSLQGDSALQGPALQGPALPPGPYGFRSAPSFSGQQSNVEFGEGAPASFFSGAPASVSQQIVYGPQLPFPEAEGEGDSGGYSGPDIPFIPAPPLQFALGGTDPDDFVPYNISSFTSINGSPGNWGQGTNWVHEVAIQWTSEETWSYTEQLSMTYSVTAIEIDNGILEDVEDPEGIAQGNDDGLVVEGSWSSNVSLLRVGYVFLTFQASRNNISTGSLFTVGGGTTWSINVTFLEIVQAVVNASMSSSVSVDPALTSGGSTGSTSSPGSGQGGEIDIPEDFTGTAAWSASVVSVQGVLGSLNMSSIPFIHGGSTPETVIVDRFIVADGNTRIFGSVQENESYSTATQSGDLGRLPTNPVIPYETAANNPLPLGGREEVDFQAVHDWLTNPEAPGNPSVTEQNGSLIVDVPQDPDDTFTGNGTATASSGSRTNSGTGSQEEDWDLMGVQRETLEGSRWMAAVGQLQDALEAEFNAGGRVDGRLISKPLSWVEPNELIGGTNTFSGVIHAGINLKADAGANVNGLAISTFDTNSEGLLLLDVTSDEADLDSDTGSGGMNFTTIKAQMLEEGILVLTDSQGNPTITSISDNKHDLVFHNQRVGRMEADDVAGSINESPVEVGGSLTWKGAGLDFVWTKSDNYVDSIHVNNPDLADLRDDDTVSMTVRYNEDVDLTGVLQGEEAVWSGTAVRNSKGNFEYQANIDDQWRVGENLIGYRDRHATFSKNADFTSTFNPSDQSVSNQLTVGGDIQVNVSGSWADPFEDPYTSGTYGPDDRTQYELSLEGIFDDWDGGLPTLPVEDPGTDPGGGDPDPGGGSTPTTNDEGIWGGLVRWFGGHRGDAGDTVINFAAGFADNLSFNATRYWRANIWDTDTVDYDGWTYTIGGGAGMLVGVFTGGTVGKIGISSLRTAANYFDEAGRCASALTKLWHGGCFVSGTPVTVSQLPYSSDREAAVWSKTDWQEERLVATASSSISRHALASGYHCSSRLKSHTSRLFHIPIEQIPIGARIPTKNPRPWEVDDSLSEPKQATWAMLSITMYRTDGGIVDAQMIRPRWWIEQHGIQAGKLLPMNIDELQVKGSALVTSIEDCPEIATGEGSVVTARFCTREVHTIAQVEILGPDGQIETLSGTPIHPIWSEDRQDWVPMGELETGESLRAMLPSTDSPFQTSNFPLQSSTVLSVTILSQSVPVYNIEVHGEHVYQVGELGILVHNAPLACVAIGQAGEIAGGTVGPRIGLKSILNPGRWRFPDKVDSIARTITETKNVAYQHLSTQLRDYVEIARDGGYQLILQVRKGDGTKIAGPLQDLIDLGTIILDPIL